MNDPTLIDARAPRFAAWITSVVLAAVLVTSSATLLALQAVVFALGAAGRSPYAAIWKRIRKSPPTELEDPRPPQFAQVVGLGFAVVGVIGFLTYPPLGTIATAFALAAAFLNAAFGFCLGCEIYLLIKRSTNKGVTA
jgi:preprotein translocase subunit Sss1